MNLQRALHGRSCSSTVTQQPGTKAFWQLSMKGYQMPIRANLFSASLCLRSDFMSKRRYFRISKKRLRAIVFENRGHPIQSSTCSSAAKYETQLHLWQLSGQRIYRVLPKTLTNHHFQSLGDCAFLNGAQHSLIEQKLEG